MKMMLQANKLTAEQAVDAVFALDLDPIKFKLMDKKEGYGWSREEADRREVEYKRFLALVAKYPEHTIVPDADVDKFWHGHILDTMKYAEDCAAVFGYFLHHFPYFGMRDEEDAAALSDAAANTRSLYAQEFGAGADVAAAYCALLAAPERPAYCAVQAPSYCAKVEAGKEAAYCARVAQPANAYCAVADSAPQRGVLAKGRPALEPAPART